MAYFQGIMKQLMDLIFGYTNSYGIAIILLTVLIKLILLPFSFMQINSMKKMQEIAPMQKKLQEKYKNDKEKLNMEIMKLYQENKINPMGGCLPVLIQFPFIIALFRVFQTYDFGGASFLWIKDLSVPDGTYILPILAAATTYLQTKIATPAGTDNPNASMSIIMPLMIGWFSLRFAAGLAFIWVVSNVVQIVQQLLFTRPQAIAKEDVNEMKILEKQAKTVDEAIQLALEELNKSRDEVEVEILEEGNRGILGFLSKSAKVKITVKPNPEEIANKFLEKLLNFIDSHVKVSSFFKEDVLNLEIESEDAGLIIGKHGSTLDALQYLTSLVVNRNSKDFVRVILDTENYRGKREKTLERLAVKMADKVKETKRSITLEPMYPNERRIIHTALQHDTRIATKSIGKEPNRRIIISLR